MGDVDIGELAKAVRRLEDINEIQTLKHRYFRCMDTANHAELRTVFHPDVTAELIGGTYQVRLSGADNYVDFIRQAIHSQIVSQHNGHHPEIRILNDSEAEGSWYLYDLFINLSEKTRMSGTALYEDQYVRHEGRWVIRHSQYRRIYEIVETFDSPPQLTAHLLAERGYHHREGAVPSLPTDA